MSIDLKSNQFSYLTHYPMHYKFYSVEFQMNLDIKYYDRTSYDILTLISDVGGIQQILIFFFGMASASFADVKIKTMVTS